MKHSHLRERGDAGPMRRKESCTSPRDGGELAEVVHNRGRTGTYRGRARPGQATSGATLLPRGDFRLAEESMSRLAQLKKAAPLMASTISASLRPAARRRSICAGPKSSGRWVRTSAASAIAFHASGPAPRRRPRRAGAARHRGVRIHGSRRPSARRRSRCSRWCGRSRSQRALARRDRPRPRC